MIMFCFSPCDRISKVLQQQQQLRRPVPSMQLPVTALLQYNPDSNSISKSRLLPSFWYLACSIFVETNFHSAQMILSLNFLAMW